jgi:uncharacterized protein (TIGR03435 family)
MEGRAGRPIRDKTGLTGKYDFDFIYLRAPQSPNDSDLPPAAVSTASDPGEDFLSAVQSHLGLRLVPKEGLVDLLIVDRWNKIPAGS